MDGAIGVKGNRMSLADVIATIGVSTLLVAFILNTRNLVPPANRLYNILNIIGAGLCGYSAYLIGFYPFVILEAVWATVATIALLRSVSRETPTLN
jgi:hypothetical protein